MKNYKESKFYFVINNNSAFIGTKFYFDDLSNVFDIEYNHQAKRLQSNIIPRIFVPAGFSKDEAVSLLTEMVEKTWRRKKITFTAFIKNKDSFLSDGKGGYQDVNRIFDNKISFLDVVNFFGKENVELYSNYFHENYEAISEVILDRLTNLYKKRYKKNLEKSYILEKIRKKEKKTGRIEAQKEELSSSYIYMKYYNFIKNNFFFEGKAFQAHIPLLDKLSLNFFENVEEDKEKNKESYKMAALRSRLIYEEATSCILIPRGKKNVKSIKAKVYESNKKEYVWFEKASQWLIPNEKYINLYLNYIFPFLVKIYSEKNTDKKENKMWSGYEIYKTKKINPKKIKDEKILRLEMTRIKQILLNPIFKQLFRFPYVEGRLFFRQYFEYITYVIGRICFRSTILPLEFIEEEENFIKRFFQHRYWSTRYKFDSVFKENFKYDFGDITFEKINKELTNEKFTLEEYTVLKYPTEEEYKKEEDELFQLEKIELYEDGKSLIKRNDVFIKGNFEETILVKFFRNSPSPEKYKISLEDIKDASFKNKKSLISTLLKEKKEVYDNKKSNNQNKTLKINEPSDPFGIVEFIQKSVKCRNIMLFSENLSLEEKNFYYMSGKLKNFLEKVLNFKLEKNKLLLENFQKMKIDKFPSIFEKIKEIEKTEIEKEKETDFIQKTNEKQLPQELFEKILYETFENVMQNNIVEREIDVGNGILEKCEFYSVNIFDYNINMYKPNVKSIIKSVLFKPIIEELRPFVVGKIDTEGKIVKKAIRLNDTETIKKILAFKHEQMLLLIEKKEKEYNLLLKNFNEAHYNALLSRMKIRLEQISDIEIRNERISFLEKKFQKEYNIFIEQKKQELFNKIENIKSRLLPIALKKEEKRAENYSINFIVKNIRKQEKNDIKLNEPAAIFLEDIHNMVKVYSSFYFREGTEKITEKLEIKDVIIEKNKIEIENFNSKLIPIDKDFLFLNVFLKLIKNFTFAVPFLRQYSEKITDQFVSFAFANDIDDVLCFINGSVFNASNLNILKSKYKLFLNHPEIKKELSYANQSGKISKKMVNYSEYLEMKYKNNFKIPKKNPFEITPENVALYEGLENCMKYHRILGENVKYLYTNINKENEIIIYSKLFSNYEEFIIQMLMLDRLLNFAWNERGKKDVELKNYKVHERTLDVYIKGEFKGRMRLNIESSEETYSTENIYEKIKKILKGSE